MPCYLYLFALFLFVLTPVGAARQSTSPDPRQATKTSAAASQKAAPTAQNTPTPAKPDYSKEPFVEEDYSLKVAFENDGTSTRAMSYRVRIQSDAGVQHYSVITFPYESATQSVEIDSVRVQKPDGTVVATGPDGIQDMPADITRQAPFYSDLREKQVAVKGLSVGDVLEARAHWQTTKPLAPGQFWFSFNFSHDNIALHEQLQISIPKGRAVKWASSGPQPTITTDGSRQIFTWTSSQLQSKTEDEQKKEREEQSYETGTGKLPAPDVEFSSFRTWAEIGAWYNALQRDRVTPDAAIRAKAAELAKGAADDNAKLRAIYEYVSTQVRYIGVAFGIGRYQPHAADEILANQYGDCKDKHTLLASLLQAAGIKAYPVLINVLHKVDTSVPSPDQFDHVITAVPQGQSFVWLDTTAELAPYGYLIGGLRNKNALLIPDGQPASLVLTPASPPIPTVQTFHIDATLSPDGTLTGKVERSISGDDIEIVLRSAFRSVSMAQWKDLVQRVSYASGFAGEVSDVTASSPEQIDQPFTFSYTYTRKNFPQWSLQHRIAMALPPVLGTPPDEKPSHPILLGDLGEVSYHSLLHLPDGYTPELPAAVDLDRPFAAYHASYSLKNGALEADRTLTVKMREVPVSEYDDYEKFSKAVADDYGLYVGLTPTHVTPASYESAIWTLPYRANSTAAQAYDEAREDYNNHDLDGEITSLKRAVEIDPKFTRAWLWMGNIYAFERKPDEAITALRSAVANDPKQPLSYKGLGFVLMGQHKFDEAASLWRQLIQVVPEDPDAREYRGEALSSEKHYAEAVAAFESAVKLTPKSAPLYTQLGSAYLQADDETKALAAYKKAMDIDSSPMSLNNIGYALADADKQLPLALQYAEKAVQQEEEASGKVKLSDLKVADLIHPPVLAAYWDTLGWVYFRMGKLDEAEKYLNAAWALSPFRLALSTTRDPELTSEMTDWLLKLGSAPENNPLKFDAGAELSHLRTFDVPGLKATKGSAEFFLLFESGPSGAKLEDVKFISGSDELKDAGKLLSSANFRVLFPDEGPEQLVRRGILTCDPAVHCSFVLYPPSVVRSVN